MSLFRYFFKYFRSYEILKSGGRYILNPKKREQILQQKKAEFVKSNVLEASSVITLLSICKV